MVEEEVSRDVVKKIVEIAALSSPADCFIRWGFTIMERALFLKQRGSSSTYQIRSEATMVLLGAVLESLEIAAVGFKIKLTYRLGGIDEDRGPTPWALVRFTPITYITTELKSMIPQLSTPADPANKFVMAVEKGRLKERARRSLTPNEELAP